MRWVLAALIAVGLTAFYYGRPSLRTAFPALARAGALMLVIALLVNAPGGTTPTLPPLVAVDRSASWLRASDTAAFARARHEARRLGGDSVFAIGDSTRLDRGGAPSDTRSAIGDLAIRAVAEGRPLVVFTDGELEDLERIADLPAGSRVEIVARREGPDLAVVSIGAPGAVVAGDTVELTVTLRAGSGGSPASSYVLTLDDSVVARAPLDSLAAGGERLARPRFVARGSGARRLAVALAAGDAEPRNDTLRVMLDVRATPAIVWVSSAPDQESRFTLAALRGTLRLPTRAYFRIAPGEWRIDGPLTPISERDVRAAIAEAPIAVIHGDTMVFGAPRAATRGRLALIPTVRRSPEDWYPVAVPPSPLAAALGGLPLDSLPPVSVGSVAARGDWTALVVARGRRFERRAAIVGVERARRSVVVDAAGLWRWSFRGGVSEPAFVAVWGAVFDWLAEERRDARSVGLATPLLRAGESPRWRGVVPGMRLRVLDASGRVVDSADVAAVAAGDSAGREILTRPLPPGRFVAVAGGTHVPFVVNPSAEWLPRPPVPIPPARSRAARLHEPLRGAFWPYLAIVLLLSVEWIARRRAGLR